MNENPFERLELRLTRHLTERHLQTYVDMSICELLVLVPFVFIVILPSKDRLDSLRFL